MTKMPTDIIWCFGDAKIKKKYVYSLVMYI